MNEVKISIMDIIDGTVVDGPGFRLSIYCAGCGHHCNGCHSQQSWEIKNGRFVDIDELVRTVSASPWNVTFSGGDPFFLFFFFALLARRIKEECGKTIWCYTGFTIEQLVEEGDPHRLALLKSIDVLVDGPFVEALKDPDLRFRGSSNQRILDREAINALLP